MGFLKNALGGGSVAVKSPREEAKEAIAYFVVLMIYADGIAEDHEIDTAQSCLARCQLFSNNTVEEDISLLARMERRMNRDAEGTASEYAAVLTKSDWKYSAASIMTDIMLCDGDMDEDELHLLTHLSGKVGISTSELESIIATVSALRRPWRG